MSRYETKRQPYAYKMLDKKSWTEPGRGIQTVPGLTLRFNENRRFPPFVLDAEEVAKRYVKDYEWKAKSGDKEYRDKYNDPDERVVDFTKEIDKFIESLDDFKMGKIFLAKSEGQRVREKSPYPYSCPKCDEYFEDGDKLMAHMVRKHQITEHRAAQNPPKGKTVTGAVTTNG